MSYGPLNYALPARRRRTLWRSILISLCTAIGVALLLLILLFVYAGVRSYRANLAWKRNLAALLIVQQKVMSYSDPPSTVIYEEDPAEQIRLLQLPGYSKSPWGRSTIEYQPAMKFLRSTPFARGPFDSRFDALPFFHSRTAASGTQRIVIVVFTETLHGHFRDLSAGVYVPATHSAFPKQIWSHALRPFGNVGTEKRLRLYAGQPDIADPSHFTIAYSVDGQPGVLDGRLTDVDTVFLSIRDGPAIPTIPIPAPAAGGTLR